MLLSSTKPASAPQTCYFSTPPHQRDYSSHFSTETPLASPVLTPNAPSDPANPLLALRIPPTVCTLDTSMDASKLLQLQTAAAHSPTRPKPQPLQDVLEVGDDSLSPGSSASSASSEASSLATPALQLIRCSRCHRSSSIGSEQGKSGFVSFGTNLYYCNRCADLVGYGG